MALNFSHRPLFPARLPEDNLVSPMRIEKVDDCCFDYGRERSDRCSSQESVHKDILDLLPSDPFDMDISTTFTAALTGLLEDYGGFCGNRVANTDGSYHLFAGLNFIWSNAMRFQAFPANISSDHKLNLAGTSGDGAPMEMEGGNASGHCIFGLDCVMEDVLSRGNDLSRYSNTDVVDENSAEFQEVSEVSSDGDEGVPHTAFSFALSYLAIRDLLVVETVCRSLHSTVRNDPLLWRNIHIDQPLNEKINDDVLLKLTDRAQGNLQCLSLVDCPRITDDGLKRVLETNPRLTKLSVPGCTRLSIEGIVSSLKAFNANTVGTLGVKHLRIGGLYGITQKHFEELKLLLGADLHMQQDSRKPHIYQRGNLYLSCEDDCAIDIELCPRCQSLKLLYDCPAERCLGKDHPTKVCRACTLCIPRCIVCGRCVLDNEYEETFSLEYVCSPCIRKYKEKPEGEIDPPESLALSEPSCGIDVHG